MRLSDAKTKLIHFCGQGCVIDIGRSLLKIYLIYVHMHTHKKKKQAD